MKQQIQLEITISCSRLTLQDYSIGLTFPIKKDIIYPTIPAKPLNDAQIGGLLFFYRGRG